MGVFALVGLMGLAVEVSAAGATGALTWSGPRGATDTVTTPHVKAQLLVYAPEGVMPDRPLWLGLLLEPAPGWHTYWKNPGDSGLATQLDWQLPSHWVAGPIDWPVPQRLAVPVGSARLINYGYTEATLLSTPVKVMPLPHSESSAAQEPAQVTVGLRASWLACKSECIPEEGTFSLTLPTHSVIALHRERFETTHAALPKPHEGAVKLVLQNTPQDTQAQTLQLTVQGLPVSWRGQTLQLWCESPNVVSTGAFEQAWHGGVWQATLATHPDRMTSPKSLSWVIQVAADAAHAPRAGGLGARRLPSQVQGRWQPTPALGEAASALPPTASSVPSQAQAQPNGQAQEDASSAGWFSPPFALALLGALLGGLILNLMPCVLPVIALKLLGFAPAKTEPKTFRALNAWFALGVVLSFACVGAVLLSFREWGAYLGWGFQMQSPSFVVALLLLFLLIALNLLDVFTLGVRLPQRWLTFTARNPGLDALASGVLVVLVATPCTAPFMGASLGLAITLPWAQALLIFVVLGVGMSLPFWLAWGVPALGRGFLRALPKPGAWMQTLRHFLAFPMLGTFLWLLWVYAQQTDVHHAFALMGVLLLTTALIWAFQLEGVVVRWIGLIVFGVAWLAAGIVWQTLPPAAASPLTSEVTAAQWQPWSPAAQAQALTFGRPVFVDFTAAWCITCQFNHLSTLQRADVRAAFAQKKVLLLRADWTRFDPSISAALRQLGRSGIPVYALYRPDSAQPVLLPEVLTPSAVLQALDAL